MYSPRLLALTARLSMSGMTKRWRRQRPKGVRCPVATRTPTYPTATPPTARTAHTTFDRSSSQSTNQASSDAPHPGDPALSLVTTGPSTDLGCRYAQLLRHQRNGPRPVVPPPTAPGPPRAPYCLRAPGLPAPSHRDDSPSAGTCNRLAGCAEQAVARVGVRVLRRRQPMPETTSKACSSV